MTAYIHSIGISFKSAELEQVAQVQWSESEEIASFLGLVRETFGIEEAFFLQTCNRREFYFYAPELNTSPANFFATFLQHLQESVGHSLDQNNYYHYRNASAALHLFRVASSLDSMVLGETEIMKQIKDQADQARSRGHVGRRLSALLNLALRSARQVRGQTEITKNVVSMASLIYRKVMDYRPERLVIVGAGHFIQSIMPTFSKAVGLELTFVNRSRPTALAAQYNGKAMTLAEFKQNPQPFDAMITATGAPNTLFNAEWLASRQHPMLILDAALPRDVEPGPVSNLQYYDLTMMEEVLVDNRNARQAEIPKTEPIFAEGLEKLNAVWLDCELATYSRQISSHYQETGERALTHLMKEHFPDLSHDQTTAIRDWTQTLVGKLTAIPILGLKGVARDIGDPAIQAFTRHVASSSNLFRV